MGTFHPFLTRAHPQADKSDPLVGRATASHTAASAALRVPAHTRQPSLESPRDCAGLLPEHPAPNAV